MSAPQDPLAGDPRSMRERMDAGDLYNADDREIAEAARRSRRLQAWHNQLGGRDDDDRRRVLKKLLRSLGEPGEIVPPFYCDYGTNIDIGDRVFLNMACVLLDVARITIGDDTQIGPAVQLLTPTHPIDPELRLAKWEAAEPITVGRNVWMGGGAIVLPGVTIGDHAVVGAGAVVTRDVPERVVVVGNPARVVRQV